jgi:hypothetical protein
VLSDTGVWTHVGSSWASREGNTHMTIPLERMRAFPQRTPAPGEFGLAVVRHEAARRPSPEVTAHAQDRARAIHQLVEDSG